MPNLTKRQLRALQVFRPGDEAIVIEPKLVKRVGYPLSLEDGASYILDNHMTSIQALIDEVEGKTTGYTHYNPTDGLIRELARYYLKRKHFGGDIRSIHTVDVEAIRGSKVRIYSKRTVKTGRYISGGGREGDYDPPMLVNEKSHVLLGIEILESPRSAFAKEYGVITDFDKQDLCFKSIEPSQEILIEQCNLLKVFDSTTGLHLNQSTNTWESAPWVSS